MIGTNQADTGRREPPGGDRVARRHALPRGGSHQAFAQDPLRAHAGAGPIAPRGALRNIRARTGSEAVAEHFDR